MGIINLSPESFYKTSIRLTEDAIQDTVIDMQSKGVDLIDLGGMSTAPYLETMIPIETEIERLQKAVCAIRQISSIPISIDSVRADVVQSLLKYEIDVINDVTGLKYDNKLAALAFKCELPVILGAYYPDNKNCNIDGSMNDTSILLSESIKIAKNFKINEEKLLLDPSIGFFRKEGNNAFYSKIKGMDWYIRDMDIISNIKSLNSMNNPICISISGKSFIGTLFNLDIQDRLIPCIVAEIYCLLNGVSLIRTHNVGETRSAINMLEILK